MGGGGGLLWLVVRGLGVFFGGFSGSDSFCWRVRGVNIENGDYGEPILYALVLRPVHSAVRMLVQI